MTGLRRGEGERSPRLAREPGNGPKVKPLDIVKISFADYAGGGEFRGVDGETLPVSPSRAPAPAYLSSLQAKR